MNKSEIDNRAWLVAQEYGGILPQWEALYIESIRYPVECCLNCFEEYDRLISSEIVEPEILLRIVQEAINHAAAISRFFWPTPQKSGGKAMFELSEARGRKLRTRFGLDSASALNDRSLRNAWEHFEERLDQYFLENETGFFMPGCIVDTSLIRHGRLAHIFKLLNPEAGYIVLMGQKFSFKKICEEVQKIHAML